MPELVLDNKPRPDAMLFLRNALMRIWHSCHFVDETFQGQQLECNVDQRVATPLFFEAFHHPGLSHVTKERVHKGYFERERYKKSIQTSTLADNIYKVDHVVEGRSSNPNRRFVFGCGETALTAEEDSKIRTDTIKCHECNRAELSLLELNEEPAAQELACTVFCFSCIVAGPSVRAFSYRMTHGLPWCQELFSYVVPETATQLTTMVDGGWVSMLEGLLATWLLAERTAAQAQILAGLGFDRKLNTERALVQGALGAKTTPRGFKTSSSKTGKDKQRQRPSESGGGSVSPSYGKSEHKRSENGSLMQQLGGNRAVLEIDNIVERRSNVRLLPGRLIQTYGGSAIQVVVKYIGNRGFHEEAHMHQAAAAIAPEGVLPLLGWTANSALIANLRLPGLPRYEELKQQGGGILIMPRGQPLRYTWQQPLELLHQVHAQLCPTLLALAQAGLYHNDLKWDNVVVWKKRLYLIDFGLAAWKQDGVNRKGARGGGQNVQAPELRDRNYLGPVGESQLVFTLGSFLMDGFLYDLHAAMGCSMPPGEPSSELVYHLARLHKRSPSDPRGAALSEVWARGLAPVHRVLASLMDLNWDRRPRLKHAVSMLGRLYHEWSVAMSSGEDAMGTVPEPVEAYKDTPGKKPAADRPRLPLVDVKQNSAVVLSL